jgi:hypothetical protein
VPSQYQIVDFPLIARTNVDHFPDLNKMVGHSLAIDLKITKIEKRTSSGVLGYEVMKAKFAEETAPSLLPLIEDPAAVESFFAPGRERLRSVPRCVC